MRSLFLDGYNFDSLGKNTQINVDPLQYQHLSKVVRLKEGEDLLLLNGHGEKCFGTLLQFGKKSIFFQKSACQRENRNFNFSIALAMPKKEAFEEVIQNSVQLGVHSIYTFASKYSQTTYVKTNDRLKNILISNYQQSNNPFKLNLHTTCGFEEIKELSKHFDHCVYFSSLEHNSDVLNKINSKDKILIFIGPEGGLDAMEEEALRKLDFQFIHLPSYILRTPTAVTAGVGFLLSRLS